MKKWNVGKILGLGLTLGSACLMEQAFSQFESEVFLGNGIHSIEVSTDPRSIAMGESFAGLYANPYAMFSNPAGLAGLRKTSIAFAQRTMNWVPGADEMKYSSVSAALPTNLFNVSLLYSKFFQGEFPVSTTQNPDGNGTTALAYDHTFGIGIAKEIGEHFGFGMSVKTFNLIRQYSGPDAALFGNVQSKTLPILFDFGMLYNHIFPSEDPTIRHQLSGGASVQNLGTVLKQIEKTSISTQTRDVTYKIPKYVRLGLSYGFTLSGADAEALIPFQLLVTGEYRNALNAYGYEGGNDFWGLGVELQMYEIASVRLGGFNAPFSSIYGNQSKMTERYGFGVNAPLNKMGGIPFSLSFDYTIIPLTQIPFIATNIKTLHLFSIRLQYEDELF